MLISANVDEMMSRQALVNLRYCQTTDDVISAALWMPMGNFNRSGMIPYLITNSVFCRAFRTDFPVVGRNHTFGVPTIYKVTPKFYILMKANLLFPVGWHS